MGRISKKRSDYECNCRLSRAPTEQQLEQNETGIPFDPIEEINMINEEIGSMKMSIIKVLGALVILVFVSCVSYRGVHLVSLTTKVSPSETELILTTTDPVQYKDTKLENPPCLIINFPDDKIFSSEEDELFINKGPIKKIKNEYYKSRSKGQRQLNFMIVELTQDMPYRISNTGSSIKIRIENPKKPRVTDFKENTEIEAQPQMSVENPRVEPGYLVGPGDVLNVDVWKEPDISREVIVNYKGEIRLPPVRKMKVIGLTIPDLEDKLVESLSKYVIEPIVFVTVKEYNNQRVIALGETTTGMYNLKRRTTLVEFLGQIGGPTDNGDLSRLKLIKKDGRVFTFDLHELIKDPQKSEDVLVSGGDTLYIPPLDMNKVYVLGEVNTPQIVTAQENITLVEAITQAGGYTPDAVTKSILVIRGELGSQKVFRVNLSRILKEADIGQNIELMPGDIVYVPRTFIADVERFLRNISLPITWQLWYLK